MKALENLERIILSNDIVLRLLSLYESKGKAYYYQTLFSKDLQSFEKNTLETDIEHLAKILELNLTDHRIKLISKKNLISKNKEEALLNNLKLILDQIQTYHTDFELIENEILEMIRMLSKNSYKIEFAKRIVDQKDLLNPSKSVSNKDYLEPLFTTFDKKYKKKEHELLQLIINLYVDFRMMHILEKNDDLIGMLIIYALISKHFSVFRYVSFFGKLHTRLSVWNRSFDQAKFYWDSGFPKTDDLFIVLMDIVESAYKDLNELAHVYEFELSLKKTETVENTILKLDEVFTKEDVRMQNPNVSDTTIDRTLKRLRDERKIMPIGKGRSSKWQRMVESNKKSYTIQQIDFFDKE